MKLRDYLDAERLTLAEFGGRIGCSHVTVHRYCTGARTPSLSRAVAIRDATGGKVGLEDWPEPRESAA